MTADRTWPLKRPARAGFVGPQMATALIEALEKAEGSQAVDALLSAAGLPSRPKPDEPIREADAAALHAALRETRPETASDLMGVAGLRAGQVILERQLSSRARALLKGGPWTVSAWMLSRALTQHAWMFAGSGRFEIEQGMRFDIFGNPFIRTESSPRPLCLFHAAMFEAVFRALVDNRLVCAESTCEAAGDDACRFNFGLA